MANTSGQAYALTIMTPVRPGMEPALASLLAALPTGERSPLARMGTTHFARWLVLHDLVYGGPPQVRDSLQSAYLIFVSTFDGDLDSYLEAMISRMGAELDAIWSHCAGFPGIDDPAAVKRYLKHNQLDTTFFYAPYGQARVPDVLDSLALRRRIADFAIAGQSLNAAELHKAWIREFEEALR